MKQKSSLHHYFGLRTVAVFEFAKGAIVLLIGLGLVSLIHRDVEIAAESILRTLHLDPAWHYSRKFIETASTMTDKRLWLLALFALAYATFRIVEAYGLWYERHWAEWLAAISSGLYVPVEIYHLLNHFTLIRLAVLLGNLLIVAYLVYVLQENRRTRAELQKADIASGK
ncbi:MAG: hypothetical protein JWQ71_2295 [Pedosphaera sp.]|nr:hypothetical protein [Pedosphaera sp.]